MKKLLALLAIAAAPLAADETAVRMLQSGAPEGAMSIHGQGIIGSGEIIAILDTGVDVDSCFFAEPDGSLPPLNRGSRAAGFEWMNIEPSRRKVIAYDFLNSCASAACDDPSDPGDWDNLGHGTFTASMAAGDRAPFGVWNSGDGLALGAKLVVQDAGFSATSPCQIPGLGCPPQDLTPLFEQVYRQGARVHSHQWGDRVGEYGGLAAQLDAFVHANPDFLVIFNSGNAGQAGPGSVTSPGLAKNALQVGGTRRMNLDDTIVWEWSGRGPASDGRIKPDLVAPSYLRGPLGNQRVDDPDCSVTSSAGTSWSAPLVAGAAALVREYFRTGFYPRGERRIEDSFDPSAALLKATLLASGRHVPSIERDRRRLDAAPLPSVEQGFGIPVLDDVLFFAGESRRLRILDRVDASGLATGEEEELPLETSGGDLTLVLVWTDPPSSAEAPGALVNDLDLELVAPDGTLHRGNALLTGGTADRINNVERIGISAAAPGRWIARVRGTRVAAGLQGFALVATGEIAPPPPRRRVARR